jgi:hypothetical protein
MKRKRKRKQIIHPQERKNPDTTKNARIENLKAEAVSQDRRHHRREASVGTVLSTGSPTGAAIAAGIWTSFAATCNSSILTGMAAKVVRNEVVPSPGGVFSKAS